MKDALVLQALLDHAGGDRQRAASFALLCLGIVESLAGGALGANEAVRLFFHADNCLYVRKQMKGKAADEIMSRGVQLPDLFESLASEDAHREYQRELAAMRLLCLQLLDRKQAA